MKAAYGRSDRYAKGILALLVTLLMVSVTLSVLVTDESEAADPAPNYNRYYYDKLDLFEHSDFLKELYDALATNYTAPTDGSFTVEVSKHGMTGSNVQILH